MMFKCKDCGCEYEIKPDFCDCGNNTFDEIDSEQSVSDTEFEYDKNIAPSKERKPKNKKTFSEQYPMLSRFLESLDPLSVIIFVLCIILSVGSFFVIKPKEIDETAQEQAVVKNEQRNVPDISTFWDDTPPKEDSSAKKISAVSNANIVISGAEEPAKPVQTVTPAKKEQPKTTVKNTQTQKNNTKATTQKSTQKSSQQTSKVQAKPQTQTQSQSQTSKSKPSTQATQTQTQTTATQTAQTVQQRPQTPYVPTVTTTHNTQELKNYKDGLKRTLFAKINLLNVYGDGTCVVDFKIDSNGKLTNRSFSKQSTNNTLNDEVYKAIMSTPTYKAPPTSYSGQTLHFTVKMANGQYSVTLN